MATTNWNLTRHRHWKISYKNVKIYRRGVSVGRGLLAHNKRRALCGGGAHWSPPERVASDDSGRTRRMDQSPVSRSVGEIYSGSVTFINCRPAQQCSLPPHPPADSPTPLTWPHIPRRALIHIYLSPLSRLPSSASPDLRRPTSNMDVRPSRAPAMATRTPSRGKIPLTRWVVYSILHNAFIDHKTTRDKISDAQTLMFCFRRKIIRTVRTVYYTELYFTLARCCSQDIAVTH